MLTVQQMLHSSRDRHQIYLSIKIGLRVEQLKSGLKICMFFFFFLPPLNSV